MRSTFIGEINNENPLKFNPKYAENLAKLEHFVLVMFDEDATVIPKESQHFEFYKPFQAYDIEPLRENRIYTEDRIGLRALDEAGKLIFINVPGAGHVDFTDDWFTRNIVIPYFN